MDLPAALDQELVPIQYDQWQPEDINRLDASGVYVTEGPRGVRHFQKKGRTHQNRCPARPCAPASLLRSSSPGAIASSPATC